MYICTQTFIYICTKKRYLNIETRGSNCTTMEVTSQQQTRAISQPGPLKGKTASLPVSVMQYVALQLGLRLLAS